MGEGLRQPELSVKNVEFKINHAEINDLALNFQRAESAEEKRKYAEMLWLKIDPAVRRLIKRKRYPNTEDVVQDFYAKKFLNAASKWREEGGNFISYCFTAVDNLVKNHFDKSKRDVKLGEAVKNEVYKNNTNIETDQILERKSLEEIKASLLDLIEDSIITPVDGMIIILKFGLGKDIANILINKFKDSDKKLSSINFDQLDFDSGMLDQNIAQAVGYTGRGTISKIVAKAIEKIKTELK